MVTHIKYLFTFLYIIIIDFIWLYLINSEIYSNTIQSIQQQKMEVKIEYAFITYIIMFCSIFMLAIPYSNIYIKNIKTKSNYIFKSLYYSGMVGFFIYGIYNFTSISIYDNYTLYLAIIDTLWGTFLYATSCTLFNYLMNDNFIIKNQMKYNKNNLSTHTILKYLCTLIIIISIVIYTISKIIVNDEHDAYVNNIIYNAIQPLDYETCIWKNGKIKYIQTDELEASDQIANIMLENIHLVEGYRQ